MAYANVFFFLFFYSAMIHDLLTGANRINLKLSDSCISTSAWRSCEFRGSYVKLKNVATNRNDSTADSNANILKTRFVMKIFSDTLRNFLGHFSILECNARLRVTRVHICHGTTSSRLP